VSDATSAAAGSCPHCGRVLPTAGERCSCDPVAHLLSDEDDERVGVPPPFPHTAEVDRWRRSAPRGVRGKGEIKRRRDTERQAMIGADEPSEDVSLQRAQRRRDAIPIQRRAVVLRNGRRSTVNVAETMDEYRRRIAEDQAAKRRAATGPDQAFGTPRRIGEERATSTGLRFEPGAHWVDPDGAPELLGDDAPLPFEEGATVHRLRERRNLAYLQIHQLDYELKSRNHAPDRRRRLRDRREAWWATVDRLDTAIAAIEIDETTHADVDGVDAPPQWQIDLGEDEDDLGLDDDLVQDELEHLADEADDLAAAWRQELRCSHCGAQGVLRRSLCDACRKYARRHGKLPTPDVLQRRRWARDAPIVTD
jgi:hypothetical protein